MKISRFGTKIEEKSLSKNQKKLESNLGENEKQFDLNHEINHLNII